MGGEREGEESMKEESVKGDLAGFVGSGERGGGWRQVAEAAVKWEK